jgi:hypothetical protein
MVITLSYEEVIKVCGTCDKYAKQSGSCVEGGEPKILKELHHCKKWDVYYGGACVFRG